MPGGKKPLPLFELVSDRDAAARREPLPTLIPTAPAPSKGTGPDFMPREPKPLPPEPRQERSAEVKRVLPGMGGKPLLVGTTALWLLAGGALLVVVAVWILGNAYGRRQAERTFERSFGTQAPAVTEVPKDPLATQEPVSTPAVSPGHAPAAEQASVLTVKGPGSDPRQAGWNYLLLGTVTREEATGAIQYLAKNGLEAFAVPVEPVDRKGGRANTSPRFQLFAARGIASGEFAGKQVERDRLKQEVARLGAVWKKEHKGSLSFSDAFWLKND